MTETIPGKDFSNDENVPDKDKIDTYFSSYNAEFPGPYFHPNLEKRPPDRNGSKPLDTHDLLDHIVGAPEPWKRV